MVQEMMVNLAGRMGRYLPMTLVKIGKTVKWTNW